MSRSTSLAPRTALATPHRRPEEQVRAMKGTVPRETLERLVALGEEASAVVQMYTGKVNKL